MTLTDKQEMLFEFVKLKHGEQKRKYTNEPYYNHLISVAQIVSQHEENCIEVALCHDLFEDTACRFEELYKKLVFIGYFGGEAYDICTNVKELTDKFTKEEFPYLNRATRKENECKRLATISYRAQTVKYADLIDNTRSIAEYDKEFSKTYLKEKEQILKVMIKGNKALFNMSKLTLQASQNGF